MAADPKKTIVLGVTGGIACYKAVELVRLLVQDGFAVRVMMSREAMEFVTPLTFQTVSGHPVATELFSLTQESEIGHINLADRADLVVVAPATANYLGKLAAGLADDLPTTVLIATRAPVLLVPSMNVHMYENPVVQQNLARLKALGYHVMEPAEGYLACGYEGKGRLPEPGEIVEEIRAILEKKDLRGERFLVTAGPTREPLDPVRYLSNRSSGKMGYAMARAALRRGAEVTLVTGPTSLAPPSKARMVRVSTAAEMREALLAAFPDSTAVVMAAAVADYRPRSALAKKMNRREGRLAIELEPNPDILAELGRRKSGQLLVGFAAETEDLLENARRKMEEKNLDLIVANDVTRPGSGFEVDTNAATILDRRGAVHSLEPMTKERLADRICDFIAELRGHGKSRPP
jgi:phosphopantothenoylcysteine decarboxylase/phosphopantothenate--cysteine ligase